MELLTLTPHDDETMENSQGKNKEMSALELLRQNNREMEELLENIEERIPKVHFLDKLLIRELDSCNYTCSLSQSVNGLHSQYKDQEERNFGSYGLESSDAETIKGGKGDSGGHLHFDNDELHNMEC